ncbi:protein SODIUM POTASSIUM ROOT DEFECTIVE 2-like [Olea europaea var. sylvestris]|uniref:protein SODIUM POTASSIUM ROOT DEFECTIVE 2-like n=1 Tax=Olea europaea var. sylvestris TaxID=158386 RepID=UPI000C1D383A|nr:protein SODIUM POTASSIUM ROOT DEFECTIVE 2-like [Olea europaea var. sylvestris]
MKGIHIFCTSQAATAICPNMSEASSSSSSSSSSAAQLGSSRAIDRYNPIIRDERRNGNPLPPLSSQPKLTPKPRKHHSKNPKKPLKRNEEAKKKKVLELEDEKLKRKDERFDNSTNVVRKSWSCTKPGDFISPAGSTRYLLNDKAFLEVLSDFDPVLKLVHDEPSKSKTDESCDGKLTSLSESPEQVVVLRVSLHCRGCERKMRKHISRMEGVKSFNIDFAAKKVTVIGDVTPLEVLSSISKVKNAQLWPPTLSSSLSPQNFTTPEFNYKGAAGA